MKEREKKKKIKERVGEVLIPKVRDQLKIRMSTSTATGRKRANATDETVVKSLHLDIRKEEQEIFVKCVVGGRIKWADKGEKEGEESRL